MASTSPWALLGLEEGASKAEVKDAFRFLSRKYHPDSSGNGATTRRFADILAAYRALELIAAESGDASLADLDVFSLGKIAAESGDTSLRLRAIRRLGYSARVTAAAFLRPCLADGDEAVVLAALRAAGDLGAQQLSGDIAALWARASEALRREILDCAERGLSRVYRGALEEARREGGPVALRAARLVSLMDR